MIKHSLRMENQVLNLQRDKLVSWKCPPFDIEGWKPALKPGRFSKHRDYIKNKFDSIFEEGNWQILWRVAGDSDNDRFYNQYAARKMFEDAYFVYFLQNPQVLEYITSNFADVYDTSKTNIFSGYDYDSQETERNHYQDIAIRTVARDLDFPFRGPHGKYLEVRNSPEGEKYNPGKIPFHLPEIIKHGPLLIDGENIEPPERSNYIWWDPLSIEDQHQEKYIFVKENLYDLLQLHLGRLKMELMTL